jgi:hypothetical protein
VIGIQRGYFRPTLPTLGVLLLVFTVYASAQHSFNGKWAMDKGQSPGAAAAPEDFQQEIKQDGSSIVIKSKYREPKTGIYPLLWVGVMTYELQLSADGSEKINQIGPFKHVSKTRVDGNRMTTDFVANIEQGSVKGQWLRTLSADGKAMTLHIQSEASDGRKLDQTLVFRRQ